VKTGQYPCQNACFHEEVVCPIWGKSSSQPPQFTFKSRLCKSLFQGEVA
jgi:hypothetical protein